MSNTFIPGSMLQPKARPSFPYYYLHMAEVAATRGDCTRRQVGAVLVDDFHLVMPGYNGTPEHGQPGCLEGACPRGRLSYDELPPYEGGYNNCIAVHAEHNALKKAQRSAGFILQNAVAYVTDEPCNDCHRRLADAGLSGVYWVQQGMWEPSGAPGYASYYDPETLRRIYNNLTPLGSS